MSRASRLYRGLSRHYVPGRGLEVGAGASTNFTDCPATALRYAAGRSGCVLVVDLGEGARLREELWLGMKARRFTVWGDFAASLVGVVPAKELRAALRGKGLGTLSDEDKGLVLRRVLLERFGAGALVRAEPSVRSEGSRGKRGLRSKEEFGFE